MRKVIVRKRSDGNFEPIIAVYPDNCAHVEEVELLLDVIFNSTLKTLVTYFPSSTFEVLEIEEEGADRIEVKEQRDALH